MEEKVLALHLNCSIATLTTTQRGIIEMKAGWIQDAWLQWSNEYWYFHLDIMSAADQPSITSFRFFLQNILRTKISKYSGKMRKVLLLLPLPRIVIRSSNLCPRWAKSFIILFSILFAFIGEYFVHGACNKTRPNQMMWSHPGKVNKT